MGKNKVILISLVLFYSSLSLLFVVYCSYGIGSFRQPSEAEGQYIRAAAMYETALTYAPAVSDGRYLYVLRKGSDTQPQSPAQLPLSFSQTPPIKIDENSSSNDKDDKSKMPTKQHTASWSTFTIPTLKRVNARHFNSISGN
jgi:hypothetical protein